MKNAGKACNNRLYRHIRTFEKIVKNYFVICITLSYKLKYSSHLSLVSKQELSKSGKVLKNKYNVIKS